MPTATKPVTPPEMMADMIVTVRCGMLATQHGDVLLGLPSFKAPLPMVGSVETPEVAVYKKTWQEGRATLDVSGYNRMDRRIIKSGSGKGVGKTNITHWSLFFFFHYTTTDVDEFK